MKEPTLEKHSLSEDKGRKNEAYDRAKEVGSPALPFAAQANEERQQSGKGTGKLTEGIIKTFLSSKTK